MLFSMQDNNAPIGRTFNTPTVSSSDNCSSLPEGWKQHLDSLFSRLPEYYAMRLLGGYTVPPGISLDNATLSGLDNFHVDRPYDTFCRDGNAVILFSLASKFPVEMIVAWKFATGERGIVRTVTAMSRLEGEIVVPPGSNDLVPKSVAFVLLERIDVQLDGLGFTVKNVVTALSYLLSSVVRLFWVEVGSPAILEAMVFEMRKQ